MNGRTTSSDGKEGKGRLRVRVKTARGRSVSSARWLDRQLNDPYVRKAKQEGYRSRAAYKFLQIQEQFALVRPGAFVIDLGAAPGGWSQVAARAAERVTVAGIDLLPVDPLPGAEFILGDFSDDEAKRRLEQLFLGRKADIVMSDMAAPTCGHPQTDALRTLALCEEACAFAAEHLALGGAFVSKIFQGGAERDLLDQLKREYTKVKHVKPDASRKESAELYVVCTGFRGEEALK